MNVKLHLLKIHHKLLPADIGQGYLPYIWLCYLGFLFFPFLFDNKPAEHLIICIAACILFLVLYFWSYWQKQIGGLIGIALMCILGSFTVQYSAGASVFFVFAGAFSFKAGSPVKAVAVLSTIVVYLFFFTVWQNLPVFFWFPAIFITVLIGAINIYQREIEKKNRLLKLSQDELKKVASSAERERIARDLHDVMGHNLSVITIKSQLAKRLLDSDIQKAKQELIELEDISRRCLREVREAISGIKKRDFATELANAKAALQSSDITFNVDDDVPTIPPEINHTLAYCLRELVTNVIRHSTATECVLKLTIKNKILEFVFSDNGLVTELNFGNGLNGIQERIEQHGATLKMNHKHGLITQIIVPLSD